MKAVMISIKPKWCELIASGKKTIELRKTRPNLFPPFKCYIYECGGKVIGEFNCEKVQFGRTTYCMGQKSIMRELGSFGDGSCLSFDEIFDYAGGLNKVVFGWCISDLVIYDKPKNLSEFYHTGENYRNMQPQKITRPPQSWCYVEELK